jgi:hypothetical protein
MLVVHLRLALTSQVHVVQCRVKLEPIAANQGAQLIKWHDEKSHGVDE